LELISLDHLAILGDDSLVDDAPPLAFGNPEDGDSAISISCFPPCGDRHANRSLVRSLRENRRWRSNSNSSSSVRSFDASPLIVNPPSEFFGPFFFARSDSAHRPSPSLRRRRRNRRRERATGRTAAERPTRKSSKQTVGALERRRRPAVTRVASQSPGRRPWETQLYPTRRRVPTYRSLVGGSARIFQFIYISHPSLFCTGSFCS
jgi:hypothetical protein